MRVKTILTATLILLIGGTAAAAEASSTASVSWTVLPFAVVGIRGGTPGQEVLVSTPLPTPSAEDVTRGYLQVSGAIGLTVRSNTGWTVLVESLSPSLGASDDGTFMWPVDSLRVGVRGSFVDVTTSPQVLASGGRGEHDLTVDYRAHLPAEGLPSGNYQAILLYTVTTQ